MAGGASPSWVPTITRPSCFQKSSVHIARAVLSLGSRLSPADSRGIWSWLGVGGAGGPGGAGPGLATGKCPPPCLLLAACATRDLELQLAASASLTAAPVLLLAVRGPCPPVEAEFSLPLQVSLTMRCLPPLLARLEPVSAAGLCAAAPRWAWAHCRRRPAPRPLPFRPRPRPRRGRPLRLPRFLLSTWASSVHPLHLTSPCLLPLRCWPLTLSPCFCRT